MYSARGNGRYEQPRDAQRQTGNHAKFRGNCHYCGKLGHKAKECNTCRRDQQKTPQHTVAFGLAEEAYSQDWVIDSGASRRLTPSRQHMRNYRSVPPQTAVNFVNGQQTSALGQGEVHLQVQISMGCTEVVLKGVLHVPSAIVNLVSTKQTMSSGAEVTFKDNRYVVTVDAAVQMEGISLQDGLWSSGRPSISQHLLWQQQRRPSKQQSCGIGALAIWAMTAWPSFRSRTWWMASQSVLRTSRGSIQSNLMMQHAPWQNSPDCHSHLHGP